MATDRQVASNRRNGALSRGPKTLAGKARSSRNAVKHGLSIAITSDRASSREIEVLARKLAQLGAGDSLGQARLAAEAELKLFKLGQGADQGRSPFRFINPAANDPCRA
jgi:hypothetical protein